MFVMPAGASRGTALPGFRTTMTFTVLYLAVIVVVPLLTLPVKSFSQGWAFFADTILDPRVIASYRLTLGTSLAAACVNGVLGAVLAWVLVRYPFPGRRIVDAMIDLPFALPTAVAGITLTSLYGPKGWLGSSLARLGIQGVFSPLGITIALIFIGLPFVVRTLQPVIADLDRELEEAAVSLGANRTQVVFRVILPYLYPAWLVGFGMAFARAIGEYGSVVFIAGNMPMKTEIASLLIITKLTQYDYAGAAAVAFVMLVLSFGLLLALNALQGWSVRRLGY
jgi:sulfate/thiosulfate transport system permease protein